MARMPVLPKLMKIGQKVCWKLSVMFLIVKITNHSASLHPPPFLHSEPPPDQLHSTKKNHFRVPVRNATLLRKEGPLNIARCQCHSDHDIVQNMLQVWEDGMNCNFEDTNTCLWSIVPHYVKRQVILHLNGILSSPKTL